MTDEAGFEALCDWRDPAAARGALVLLSDRAGRVALQFRDRGAPVYPGMWGFFGGGVEAGETLAEAAVRELEEEAALTLDAAALRPGWRVVSPESRARLYIFTCVADVSPADFRVGEGGGFGLFTPADWAPLPLVPFVRDALGRHAARAGS